MLVSYRLSHCWTPSMAAMPVPLSRSPSFLLPLFGVSGGLSSVHSMTSHSTLIVPLRSEWLPLAVRSVPSRLPSVSASSQGSLPTVSRPFRGTTALSCPSSLPLSILVSGSLGLPCTTTLSSSDSGNKPNSSRSARSSGNKLPSASWMKFASPRGSSDQ